MYMWVNTFPYLSKCEVQYINDCKENRKVEIVALARILKLKDHAKPNSST